MRKIVKQTNKDKDVFFQLVNEDGQLKTHPSKVVGFLPINEIPSKGVFVLGDFVQVEIDGDYIYSNNLKEAIYKSFKEESRNSLERFLKGKPTVTVSRRLRRSGTLQQILRATIERNYKVEIIPSKIFEITSESSKVEKLENFETSSVSIKENPPRNFTQEILQKIPSKIIKITPKIVVFECITDIENQLYETREFPALLFEKYNYLKIGLVCNLNVALSPNNLNLTITNLNDSNIEKLFDTSDLFDDLEGFENVHYH